MQSATPTPARDTARHIRDAVAELVGGYPVSNGGAAYTRADALTEIAQNVERCAVADVELLAILAAILATDPEGADAKTAQRRTL